MHPLRPFSIYASRNFLSSSIFISVSLYRHVRGQTNNPKQLQGQTNNPSCPQKQSLCSSGCRTYSMHLSSAPYISHANLSISQQYCNTVELVFWLSSRIAIVL